MIAVVIAWAVTGGGYESQPALDAGYDPTPWFLGALAILGILCATSLGIGRIVLARPTKVACGALTAYVVWSYLSIGWAHDKGTAFLGSDRALVYLAAFVAFAILPWTARSARIALAMFAAGIAALAIAVAIRVATLADPSSLYLSLRLAYPLGYYNANAALFMTGAVVAIALSAARDGHPVLRVAGLISAGLCLQLAILGQSRGWLFSVPLIVALMLVLVPGRLRLLAFALLPAAAAAASTPALLRVYGRASPNGAILRQPRLSHVLHAQGLHAVHTMLIADVILAVTAAIAVALDRRLELSAGAARRLNRAGAIAAIGLAVGGVAAGLIAVKGHPLSRAESAWHAFASTPKPTAGGYSHFTTLATSRTDLWRVALHEFSRAPLIGIGQDNFATAYTRLRRTEEKPRWVHSFELRLLTHTGAIGALAFAVFLIAALAAALPRGRSPQERAIAGALLLPLLVWLIHGSVDWFWEYPALSVPALAFTAAAAFAPSAGRAPQSPAPAPAPARRLSPASLAIAALACCGLAALALPFIAAEHVKRATVIWPQRPALAYGELRAASGLMPFDSQIDLVGASIALDLEQEGSARAWLVKAQGHEDQEWLTPFLLGLIDGRGGHAALAMAELRRALRLNPREAAISQALRRLRQGHPMTFEEAQVLLAPRIVTPPA